MMTEYTCGQKPILKSAVYVGNVRHRRFRPAVNAFNYKLYMLGLDVDEVESKKIPTGIFGFNWYNPVRFVEKDYLKGEPGNLRKRITDKVISLGGIRPVAGIRMLVQARCLGLYFSPANFFFCYNHEGNAEYMLVEVSNTPWNKRYYYLVDLSEIAPTEKSFHVSPFMDLAMQYHWRVKTPEQHKGKLLVHIENHGHDKTKLFDASLVLKEQPLTKANMFKVWLGLPAMTLKVVGGIYYQALKLFAKRVPFVPYQEKANLQKHIESEQKTTN